MFYNKKKFFWFIKVLFLIIKVMKGNNKYINKYYIQILTKNVLFYIIIIIMRTGLEMMQNIDTLPGVYLMVEDSIGHLSTFINTKGISVSQIGPQDFKVTSSDYMCNKCLNKLSSEFKSIHQTYEIKMEYAVRKTALCGTPEQHDTLKSLIHKHKSIMSHVKTR